jgi:hypothetical protein
MPTFFLVIWTQSSRRSASKRGTANALRGHRIGRRPQFRDEPQNLGEWLRYRHRETDTARSRTPAVPWSVHAPQGAQLVASDWMRGRLAELGSPHVQFLLLEIDGAPIKRARLRDPQPMPVHGEDESKRGIVIVGSVSNATNCPAPACPLLFIKGTVIKLPLHLSSMVPGVWRSMTI